MSVLDRLQDLTPDELSRLVTATSQILLELGDSDLPLPPDLLEMPPPAVARLINSELPEEVASQQQIVQLVEDPAISRALALKVISLVSDFPELHRPIEQRYDELERRMFVPELMLLIAALVVLAIRIKRVKLGHAEVTFYPAGDEVKSFVTNLATGVID